MPTITACRQRDQSQRGARLPAQLHGQRIAIHVPEPDVEQDHAARSHGLLGKRAGGVARRVYIGTQAGAAAR